jgi:Ca2+-binding EF-hand superfamily protein
MSEPLDLGKMMQKDHFELINLISLQFDRMDCDNDGYIDKEDIERFFPSPQNNLDIIFRAFTSETKIHKFQFILQFLKLIEELY